jgi:hypothetical protein
MCAAVGTKSGDPDAATRAVRTPVMWGLLWGAIQAASPIAFWWLDAATVYALGLVLIAAIYIGLLRACRFGSVAAAGRGEFTFVF